MTNGDEDNLPEYFIESQDIKPLNRIKMQSTWQKYIDTAISSTINLPEETTIEEIEDIYMNAWKYICWCICLIQELNHTGENRIVGKFCRTDIQSVWIYIRYN